jgi:hypothetical protein
MEKLGINNNEDIEEDESEKGSAFKPELLDNSLLEDKLV